VLSAFSRRRAQLLYAGAEQMTTSFEELADSYKCLFFDAFGVLKSSAGVYEGVLDRLRLLRERGKQIYLVTNDSSKSPHRMVEAYTHPEAGPLFPLDHIISSGLLASDYLKNKVRSGWVAYLGKDASAYYIAHAGLHPVPLSQVVPDEHSPKALVLLDDEGFDWFADINRAVNLVRRYNIPVVVANTDITYPKDRTEVGVAVGGLAKLLEQAIGREFVRFGKPDPMIFSKAFHLALTLDPSLTKRDVLMVGDTLFTDISGGNKYGIDTALVLSGTTLDKDHKSLIQATGIIPNYVCESILT
jgi:HAD superfamily hydrolase (TIGR01450 family)